jgi:hypothetical protein
MSFDRTRLPDPQTYYESQGLKLVGRGPWRITECQFHGGSDSMSINIHHGGFHCWNCCAKGGDVLAYHMALHGMDFLIAAKDLGAWVDDGRTPIVYRPTPLPARDALRVLWMESTVVAVAAANLGNGHTLTPDDLQRVIEAGRRITTLVEAYT